MAKKTAAQLDKEIAKVLSQPILKADWPDAARHIIEKAARWYHHEVNEPFAVPDVLLDQAIEDSYPELERADRAGEFEDAKASWHRRYGTAKIEAEMRDAIQRWSRAVRRGTPRM